MAFFTEHSIDEPQYHIHCKAGDVGRYVFLPGDPFRTDLIASYFDDAKLVAHNREHKTWTGYLDGVKVSATSTGMGCPSTAIALEELIKIGADTFIRIGTAGRVAPESYDETLDGIIVNAAVRDEGTTLHYVPAEFPAVADRHVVDALARAAKAAGLNFREGITQSKDSFYGQHEPDNMPAAKRLHERWQAWEKSHVLCSEMEASALFVISSIRGCRAAAIMDFKDMGKTVGVACDAVRILAREDGQRKQIKSAERPEV
ncbi:MAG: nucleoside phosphorylase [Oscillospiraceae bacterium]|nr:nucleoside phosphorylase [Oscillospiraceae bacterium]